MTVCGHLYTSNDSAGTVLHEVHGPIRPASTNEIRNDQLGIRVDPNPRPPVAPADFFLFGTNVFSFCADVRPYLIALQTAHTDVANMRVVELHAGRSEIDQEFGYRIAGDACHPGS